jgi:hypothetical protein
MSTSSDSAPGADASVIAPLRRLVHDLANAVQAQDLAAFHEGARAVATEATRVGAPEVAAAATALLAQRPADDDAWDDAVGPVRAVQQAMRALRARLEGAPPG